MTPLGLRSDTRRRLTSPRIAEIVADELRRQIIDGELADGDLLPRQEILVEHFNISLTSVRAALRILETEGLVSVRRGNRGGAVVHTPAKANAAYMLGLVLESGSVQLSDLAAAMHELEPGCAAMAAGRQDRHDTVVPELQRINEAMADHLDNAELHTKLGREFHEQVARGCGNQTMIAVVGSLEALWTGHDQHWAEETVAGAFPSRKDRRAVLSAHVRVTEAIASGDAEKARRLAARHLGDAQTHVLSGDPQQRIMAKSAHALSRPRRARQR